MQRQNTVELILLDGSKRLAAATGNNAAWACPCERPLPLVGRSDPSDSGTVECPQCARKYRVVPEAGPLTRALQVTELP